MVALLPGVVYNAAADSSSDSVTINGQNGSGVVYLMDGGSNNDDLRGGSSGAQARPPLEAIQEFQVVTNQFDAEYGAATAGVVNAVTKQGTNAWHGSGVRLLHRRLDDGEGFLRRRSRVSTSRRRRRSSGAARSAVRSSATRCISSPASSGRIATRAGAASIRRGPTAASRSRRKPTRGITWGASITS